MEYELNVNVPQFGRTEHSARHHLLSFQLRRLIVMLDLYVQALAHSDPSVAKAAKVTTHQGKLYLRNVRGRNRRYGMQHTGCR